MEITNYVYDEVKSPVPVNFVIRVFYCLNFKGEVGAVVSHMVEGILDIIIALLKI